MTDNEKILAELRAEVYRLYAQLEGIREEWGNLPDSQNDPKTEQQAFRKLTKAIALLSDCGDMMQGL